MARKSIKKYIFFKKIRIFCSFLVNDTWKQLLIGLFWSGFYLPSFHMTVWTSTDYEHREPRNRSL